MPPKRPHPSQAPNSSHFKKSKTGNTHLTFTTPPSSPPPHTLSEDEAVSPPKDAIPLQSLLTDEPAFISDDDDDDDDDDDAAPESITTTHAATEAKRQGAAQTHAREQERAQKRQERREAARVHSATVRRAKQKAQDADPGDAKGETELLPEHVLDDERLLRRSLTPEPEAHSVKAEVSTKKGKTLLEPKRKRNRRRMRNGVRVTVLGRNSAVLPPRASGQDMRKEWLERDRLWHARDRLGLKK